jgi:hypothetical protein
MMPPSLPSRAHRLAACASAALAASALVPTPARASDPTCPPAGELSIERLVRRLSIDLRGTLPEMSDYAAAEGADHIPDWLLDAYLASDELRLQLRRHHEKLLWTNPSIAIGDVGFSLTPVTLASGAVHYVTGRRGTYRGGDGTHVCQDKPQSAIGYEADGRPKAEWMGKDNNIDWYAEGWVEVHPYWEPNPAITIKVCAFDAQTSDSYTITTGASAGTYTCDNVLAHGQLAADRKNPCGCGPELAYCVNNALVQPVVLAAMREQLLRLVDLHTVGGRPYSELVTTKTAHVNGPLVHYVRYLASQQSLVRTQNFVQPADGALPSLAYLQHDTWMEVEREEPHAGILTLPAYLLRFQTNRGRANRYRIAFQGQYYQPPSTKDQGCAEVGNDLTERCVCRGCHVSLEPLAAHFGQFVEAGSTVLRDFVPEFATASECALGGGPSSTTWCNRFYMPVPSLLDPDLRPYRLKALEYGDAAHPLVEPHFDAGPLGLAEADIASGVFHEVAVEHLFEFVMKRPPNLDLTSPDYEGDDLAVIANEFRTHDDIRLALRALVSLPAYRRTP